MKNTLFPSLLALLYAATPAAAQPVNAAGSDTINAEIRLVRTDPRQWRVEYTFDREVSGIRYGPDAAGYRAMAWSFLTPSAQFDQSDDADVVRLDEGVTALVLRVTQFTAYEQSSYAPMVPFSDGGAALYLGYFTGEALVDGDAVPVRYRFHFTPLAGERVSAPDPVNAGSYVYFGVQQPVQMESADVILDPGAPAWMSSAFAEVIAQSSRRFAAELGELPHPPLVFIGAGDLHSVEGASVKGGAVGSQFVMTAAGRALLDGSPRMRSVLSRLVAHELAHVWQLHTLPQAFSPTEPWLHEGAAEALAVHALHAAGLWDDAAVAEFTAQAEARCDGERQGQSLVEAAARGADVAYACGFGLFGATSESPGRVWMALVHAVREGRPYALETLASVLASPPQAGRWQN